MAETLTIRTATSTDVVKIVEAGPQGPAGSNGQGVPVGGTAGQVLRKASGTNYDTEWAAAASGSGSVTSVALAGTGLSISGSPVTTSGTITANVSYGTTAGTACQGNDARIANIKAGSISNQDGTEDNAIGGSIRLIGNNAAAGSINLSASTGNGSGEGGSITSTGSANNNTAGGSLNMSGGTEGGGGYINTSDDGGSINTRGTGSIELGVSATRTTLAGTATAPRSISLPNASGTIALTTTAPASHTHGNITNGGLVGTTSGLPIKTGTGGIVEAGAFGTSAGEFAEGNHTHSVTAITQATNRILGRTTASTGGVEELTVGSGLTLASGSLNTSSLVALLSNFLGAVKNMTVLAPSADVTVISNTTLAGVSGMSFTAAANTTYLLICYWQVDTGAGGYRMILNVPSNFQGALSQNGYGINISGANSATGVSTIGADALNIQSVSRAAAQTGPTFSIFAFRTTSTGGTTEFRFSQATSTATNSTLKAESRVLLIPFTS